MRPTWITFALCAALALSPLAAQPGPEKRREGPPKAFMLERMAERLKLTEEQKSKVQAIHTKYAEELKAKRQSAREASKAFHQSAQKPETTVAQLKPLHQAMADKNFEVFLAQRAQRLDIRALLTPEQQVEMEKMQAFRQGMMAGRRGGRGPRL